MRRPHSRLCVPISSPATGLFELELASLQSNLTIFHVPPDLIQSMETQAHLLIMSNLLEEPCILLKYMLLARDTTPSPFVVGMDAVENLIDTASEITDIAVAAVHIISKEI